MSFDSSNQSNSENDNDMEMAEVCSNPDDDEDDLGSEEFQVDSEYGEYREQTLAPRNVSKNSSVVNNDFYRTSMRRQNVCFGTSMLSIAGMFVAAYFLMGLSFSPSNIGIFGDESFMKGSSGEVGLDADNAETQEIIDEEVIEIEEEGNFGENANAPKTKKEFRKWMKNNQNNVGKNDWVEDKDWWEENADNIKNAEEKKTSHEKKKEQLRKREERKKRHWEKKHPGVPYPGDIDEITEKLASHYNHTASDALKKKKKHTHPQKRDRPSSGGNTANARPSNESEKQNDEIEEEKNITNEEKDLEGPSGVQSNEETLQIDHTISTMWTVLAQVGHDKSSFTQGLSYGGDGTIYETTGLYGKSKVRKINPETFEVEQEISLQSRYFGEGSTYYTDSNGDGRLIEITWKERKGFIYNAETLETIKEFDYKTGPRNQGWGITYDAMSEEFIVSDGTSYLYFWDRDSLREKRRVQVTRFDGSVQDQLNELEFMDGLVCMNIWHSDEIICADPSNGNTVREYDMSTLWPAGQRGGGENVLNGIALGKDHVLITGKRWDRMYKVIFSDWPSLFAGVTESALGEYDDLQDEGDKEEDKADMALVANDGEGEGWEGDKIDESDELSDGSDGLHEQTGEVEEDEGENISDESSILEEADSDVEQEEVSEETYSNVIVQGDTDVGEEANAISSKWTVLEQVYHDTSSFTQGISYGNDGTIFETTGMYGESKVYKINPETYEVELEVSLNNKFFGEGSTFFVNKRGKEQIIEITWQEQTGFIYDADTLQRRKKFEYTTTAPRHEGWGITYDEGNQEFIVSDGSSFLYFWDRDTLEEKRKVQVTRFDGRVQNQLNELEFMDGLVCCNIWHSDDIICVNPKDGKSVREYDMSSLWPAGERGGSENVLNGIALGEDHVLITGKRWDRMYKLNFSDWPSLFSSGVTGESKQ